MGVDIFHRRILNAFIYESLRKSELKEISYPAFSVPSIKDLSPTVSGSPPP